MFTSSKSVRMFVLVLFVLALLTLSACSGGSGNPVEGAVSDAVSNGIDTATGNNAPDANGICYDHSGIVAIEIPCQ